VVVVIALLVLVVLVVVVLGQLGLLLLLVLEQLIPAALVVGLFTTALAVYQALVVQAL
jgi:hypothetical protein